MTDCDAAAEQTSRPARPAPPRMTSVSYKAEYIWIDGTEPTAKLRSKTKILADGEAPGVWGF
ncbi:glutamine synthetase, partial [Streptomyces sp. NPDC088732]